MDSANYFQGNFFRLPLRPDFTSGFVQVGLQTLAFKQLL